MTATKTTTQEPSTLSPATDPSTDPAAATATRRRPKKGEGPHLGGGVGLEVGFGRKLRAHKVTSVGLTDYVELVVRRYLDEREPGERFAAWAGRADEADEEALR